MNLNVDLGVMFILELKMYEVRKNKKFIEEKDVYNASLHYLNLQIILSPLPQDMSS